MLDKIGPSIPRTALAQAIAEDQTLRVVKGLAKEQKNGYREEDGVILRSRLDDCGNVLQQICLPVEYRQTCLRLAHTKFWHQGRNKMVSLVRQYFYWPSLTSDCLKFIRSCEVCQKQNKTNPPKGKMQMR